MNHAQKYENEGPIGPLTGQEVVERDGLVKAAALARIKQGKYKLRLGRHLRDLLEKRLFRGDGETTWEEFVPAMFDFGPDYAYKLINLARVNDTLAEAGEAPLATESHARAVAPIKDPGLLLAAVRRARGMADDEGKRAVADHFKAAREEVDPGSVPSWETVGENVVADVVPCAEVAAWPYGDDARARFQKIPAVDQEAVRDALAFASLGEEVTAETVEEAAQVAAAERVENGGRPGRPGVVGVAVGIVALNRKRLEDASREIQIDIDYVPELGEELGGERLQGEACETWDAGGRKTPPLLVVILTGLCPDALLDAHPGARGIAEQKAELIVEISELEAFGGPVENGVLNIAAVRRAARESGIRKTFNKTGALVGWANYSTNPLTGCTHNCQRQFCYASDVALRFYPQAFVPTIHPARLDAFANTPLPDPERTSPLAPGWARTVFLGSMGDLFNHSFPDWWIQAVLDEIKSHPDWTVFVLTKMGPRLGDFEFPANAAIGVTVTRQKDVRAAAKGLERVRGGAFKWVSLEPFLDRVDVEQLLSAGATLFAVGGRSRTRWSGEFQPDPAWVRDVVKAIYARDAHFYSKDNLDWRGHIPFPGREPWSMGAPQNAKSETGHGDGAPRAAASNSTAVMARGPPARLLADGKMAE